ncbi:MAG: hypothetical protein IT376_05950 [Polyangiaceae bacterium]|nr:hypothetical protein [Polyangiaceae bacterium]
MNRFALPLILAFGLSLGGCSGDDGGGAERGDPFDTSLSTTPSGGPDPVGLGADPYPAGPYGFSQYSVIPNFQFLGWRDPAAGAYDPAALEVIKLSDYYDPDGAKGSRLLHVNLSAVWCGYCRAEHAGGDYITQDGQQLHYEPIEEEVDARAPRGLRYLEALVQDSVGGPATKADLEGWASEYAMGLPFVLDPNDKLAQVRDSLGSFPTNFLITTHDMKIVQKIAGANPDALWDAADQYLAP